MNPDLTKIVAEMRATEHMYGSTFDKLKDWADRIEAALSSPAKGAEPWQEGNPVIPKGTDKYFIVACRRKSGKIHTFPATFCNDYILMNDNPRTASGPGWSSRELELEDESGEAVSGWFDCESSEGDYDSVYRPLLTEGEAVIAWQEIPSYAAPVPKAAPVVMGSDECAWMVYFYDTDRKPEIFSGAGAKSGALARFAQISASWNAVLLCEFARNDYPGWHKNPALLNVPTPALMDLGKVMKALDNLRAETKRLAKQQKKIPNVCESGCEGRCVQCPQDFLNEQAAHIANLIALLDSLAPDSPCERFARKRCIDAGLNPDEQVGAGLTRAQIVGCGGGEPFSLTPDGAEGKS